MSKCPVCSTIVEHQYPSSPYWACPSCDLWFQDPMPPKTYEAAHEKDEHGDFTGHLMSDHDKKINAGIAKWLFDTYMKATPGKILDIGSKYPYLAHCFKNLGCDAFGMDNIDIVPEYSKSLEVPMLMADFEKITDEQIIEWTHTNKFQLITLVHVFEHLYNPLEALRRLRRMIADDGFVYIRSPDHGVTGFERDLTPGHYTIHPYFWSFPAVLELLVQAKDLFTVEWQRDMPGAGQRDIILRPLTHKPRVWAGMIVKNEERDLPRCLKSIEEIVDGVVIVDTGSVDKTEEAAKNAFTKPMLYSTYTGASRKDDTGDWKLWDFGKARNQYVERIEKETDADYVLWMDADDELLTPVALRRVFYWNQYSVFGVQIEAHGQKWIHHRLWKNGLGIKYDGRCHEYPTMGGFPCINLNDTVVRHDAAPGFGENANVRNLRILEEEFKDNPTPRVAFYLGNTHKDAGRWAEAIPVYAERISMGVGYWDEWLFAYLYKARAERALGKLAEAKATLLEALSKASDWSEFWMELAYIAHDEKLWAECIGYCWLAQSKIPPATQLWREWNKYSDQPLRTMSWAYEFLNDTAQALHWAEKAKTAIGVPDADWDARIARLKGAATPLSTSTSKIALHRPGAIGDIIMTLNMVPELRKEYPDAEIHYFCAGAIADQLHDLMFAAGIKGVHDCASLDAKKGDFDSIYNLIGYPLAEGYPEKKMQRHLLQYFAEEMGLDPAPIRALTLQAFPRPEGLPQKYATLQVKAGWSVYKNWPMDRWEKVVAQCPEIPIFQIGTSTEPRIVGADHRFMGTPLMTAVNILSNSSMHLGVDSFANHLTNYYWMRGDVVEKIRGVILWGSTQASAAGYAHNENISLDLFCQPCFREDPAISKMSRGPCITPPNQVYQDPHHACMFGIKVETVVAAAKRQWNK